MTDLIIRIDEKLLVKVLIEGLKREREMTDFSDEAIRFRALDLMLDIEDESTY